MKRINTLDGLRGIAVLMVVAGHVTANYQPLNGELRRWLFAFANPGVGVRLFFVLSGYLITQLLAEEKAATGTISLSRFYWRRILRIFPAFYVYLLTLIVMSLWVPCGINLSTALTAGTFTWNYSGFWIKVPPEGIWNLGHLWTLALEQQFYLFWPVILLLFGFRRAVWVAVLLTVWCPLARVAVYFLFPAQRGAIGMMLHTSIDSLMIGCATALICRTARGRGWLNRFGATGAVVSTVWLALISPIAAEVMHGFPVVAGFTLDAVSAGWIIVWVHHRPPPFVARLLGQGVLPALGLISYSLYVWQQVFLSPAGPLQQGRILLPCLGALGAAIGSYYLVERPALRFKTRWRSPASPTPATRLA